MDIERGLYMFVRMVNEYWVLAAMAVIAAIGMLSRIFLGGIYRSLLKDLKRDGAPKHKLIQQMKKNYGYPSYNLICKATSGDEKAIREILDFYNAYISKVCLRPCYHANGALLMQVDEELKGEIHAEMMKAILKFEIRVK